MDMKWVTRERAKVDRIASPWLVRKFVGPESEFFFVPADRVKEVARAQDTMPFDTPGVELTHYKEGDDRFLVHNALYSYCKAGLEGAGGMEHLARS